eukprot:3066215-Amphidinium_carterae.1
MAGWQNAKRSCLLLSSTQQQVASDVDRDVGAPTESHPVGPSGDQPGTVAGGDFELVCTECLPHIARESLTRCGFNCGTVPMLTVPT